MGVHVNSKLNCGSSQVVILVWCINEFVKTLQVGVHYQNVRWENDGAPNDSKSAKIILLSQKDKNKGARKC